MCPYDISPAVRYVGADDTDLDLFENQYPVPNGVSYNAYVILDEKIALIDTVDRRKTSQWLAQMDKVLDGREPDYLVIQHMEPDHAGSVGAVLERFPHITVVATAKALPMLSQFYPDCPPLQTLAVKEGDTLSLGSHTLHFVMAPMVHWPEVMVSYEDSEKILFSADGFGTFGALSAGKDWLQEARRYYFNIVGKYGAQVQVLLKKASALDIATIAPLHGPILRENLAYYLGKYDLWSRYEPEDEGVLVACASIHGHTAGAAQYFAQMLAQKGCAQVVSLDLCRCDQAEAVEAAFRHSCMALFASSYDGGLFPPMEHFLSHLRDKTYRNRRIALVENGSWAPSAGRVMRSYLDNMKGITLCEPVITLRGAVKNADRDALGLLAEELLKAGNP